MRPKKEGTSAKPDDEAESYYVSIRDLPFDVLRQRATCSTLTPAERRAARRDLLLKMGAKPPKGTAMNYRVLMETRKREKEAAKLNYHNERLKKTIIERQLGQKVKNKKKLRQQKRKGKKQSKSKPGAVMQISKNLAKKIRQKKRK